MKTVFFKNLVPVAVFAVGIAGAFATTSMQSASKSFAFEQGWTLNGTACNIPVSCSDIPKPVCLQNVTSGAQAFAKDAQGNCNKLTYRP